MDFITATQNAPFLIALCVMFGVAVLEGVGTLLGGGFSQLIDSVLPDLDLDIDVDLDVDADVDVDVDLDVDADVDADLDAPSGPGLLTRGLGWLQFGKVPALVLLVLFLTVFGLGGLGLQAIADSILGILLPTAIAVPAALCLSLPVVRVGGGWIAHLIPKDETSAVSSDTFVGRVATIVLGTARASEPTQARLHDEHGRSHYVLVEPDIGDEELSSGTEVLLVRRDGARFRAIRAPHAVLVDSVKV
jgi:hypothetical protein